MSNQYRNSILSPLTASRDPSGRIIIQESQLSTGQPDIFLKKAASDAGHTALLDNQPEQIKQPATLEDSIDGSSSTAFARSMVGYFKEHPGEVGIGRYTEVYVVDNKPVVVVAPREMRPYGATIEGTHALVDELRAYDEGKIFPKFMDAIAKNGGDKINTDSLAAKGILKADAEGQMQLELLVLRGRESAWLGDLQKETPDLGLSDVILNERYPSRPYEAKALKDIKANYGIDMQTEKLSPESLDEVENPGMVSGVITELNPEVPEWSRTMGPPAQHVKIGAKSKEANVITHNALYKAAGMADPHGFMTLNIDGQTVKVGARYNSDQRDDTCRQAINIFYDKDYGDSVAGFEEALVESIQYGCLPSAYGKPVEVRLTVSKGNKPSETFSLSEN